MSSPTQRTLAVLRNEGWTCDIVERWNQFSRRRIDLFGFIDLVAIGNGGIVGVQCCAGASHSARRNKIIESETAPLWLSAGGRIQIWSWSKRKVRRGSKAMRWVPRVEEIATVSSPQEALT